MIFPEVWAGASARGSADWMAHWRRRGGKGVALVVSIGAHVGALAVLFATHITPPPPALPAKSMNEPPDRLAGADAAVAPMTLLVFAPTRSVDWGPNALWLMNPYMRGCSIVMMPR